MTLGSKRKFWGKLLKCSIFFFFSPRVTREYKLLKYIVGSLSWTLAIGSLLFVDSAKLADDNLKGISSQLPAFSHHTVHLLTQ